jgi:hypothetical protein
MLEISLDVKDFNYKEEDESFLSRLKKRLDDDSDFRVEVEKALGEVMMEDLRKRFSSSPPTVTGGGVWGGEYWHQLSHSYLLSNPERANGRVYIDSGALMNSLTTYNFNLINTFEKDEYSFGTKIPYADRLQELRPIVFFHPQLLDKLSEAYLKVFLKADGLEDKFDKNTTIK